MTSAVIIAKIEINVLLSFTFSYSIKIFIARMLHMTNSIFFSKLLRILYLIICLMGLCIDQLDSFLRSKQSHHKYQAVARSRLSTAP